MRTIERHIRARGNGQNMGATSRAYLGTLHGERVLCGLHHGARFEFVVGRPSIVTRRRSHLRPEGTE